MRTILLIPTIPFTPYKEGGGGEQDRLSALQAMKKRVPVRWYPFDLPAVEETLYPTIYNTYTLYIAKASSNVKNFFYKFLRVRECHVDRDGIPVYNERK